MTPLEILTGMQVLERKLNTSAKHLSQRDLKKLGDLNAALYDHRLIVEINAHDVDRFEQRISEVADDLLLYREYLALAPKQTAPTPQGFVSFRDCAVDARRDLRESLRNLRDECTSMFKEGATL